MKEKTFDELIEELQNKAGRNFFMKEEVEALMQQVREATKAEILTSCDDNFFRKEPKGKLMENIENLPPDRILTDK